MSKAPVIESHRYVVAVAVEMVMQADDPSEPCYEAETIELVREVKRQANAGDLAWLQEHGKVYQAVGNP